MESIASMESIEFITSVESLKTVSDPIDSMTQ